MIPFSGIGKDGPARRKVTASRCSVSINDVPAVRDLFSWAEIELVSTTYSIPREANARGALAELLIRNFKA